jgi:WD40 repeat protein
MLIKPPVSLAEVSVVSSVALSINSSNYGMSKRAGLALSVSVESFRSHVLFLMGFSGDLPEPLKHSIYSIAIDPAGHVLAAGSPERAIRTWDPRTGKKLTGKLVGHTDNIRSMLVSDDGRMVMHVLFLTIGPYGNNVVVALIGLFRLHGEALGSGDAAHCNIVLLSFGICKEFCTRVFCC